jgi:hypothetical protein
VRDLIVWEPGQTLICVLCGRERGGDDPPRNWIRHRPSHRRRIPIWGPGDAVLGHFEFVML